jgi:putative membrane protein
MLYVLLRWLLNTFILILVSLLAPGVSFDTFWSALATSVILGLINAVIRPIMIVLTLPINILTLGLFTLVINALMFWLASAIVKGFTVTDFWSAFFAALIYWLIIMVINWIDTPKVKQLH